MDVLLVEDEPLVRAAAAEALRAVGLDVAEAASAEEATDGVDSGASTCGGPARAALPI